MQKILAIMVVCILGGLVFRQASDSRPILNDVVLANVEALADAESDIPGAGTTGSCTEVCYKYDGWMCTRIYNGETSRCVHYRKK